MIPLNWVEDVGCTQLGHRDGEVETARGTGESPRAALPRRLALIEGVTSMRPAACRERMPHWSPSVWHLVGRRAPIRYWGGDSSPRRIQNRRRLGPWAALVPEMGAPHNPRTRQDTGGGFQREAAPLMHDSTPSA